MADIVYRADDRTALPMQTNWGAVWSGLFTFIGIWAVFDLLGYAIFPRAANGGIDMAWGIWSIVLAAIAMFVAGRVTGTLAALRGSSGVRHGMIMFGLSVAAAVVLTWASSLLAGFSEPGTMTRGVMPSLFPHDAWVAFGTLFLGWLGAMFGASSAAAPKSEMAGSVKEIRPAA
jgi:hypothetical protein